MNFTTKSMVNNDDIISEAFVSIIIVNYNGGKDIIDCIESINKTVNNRYEIILIDNNSTDNSQKICKQKFPSILLIQNERNLGLSARNIGLKKAKGNFIVFLDSDTIVKDNWLSTLIDCYRKNGNGLYQPKLLEKDRPEIIDNCGNMINIFGLAYSRGKGEKDIGRYEKFQTISYTAGSCSFFSTQTMKKIGMIDEVFFAYHDDVDYGWRAKLIGIPSYYEPKAIVYHKGSKTLKWSKKKFFLLERNRIICVFTLYSIGTLLRIFPLLILVDIGIFIFFLKKGMGYTKLKANLSILKLIPKITERRKKILHGRTSSDKEVIKKFVDDFHLPDVLADKESSAKYNSLILKLSKFSRKLINI